MPSKPIPIAIPVMPELTPAQQLHAVADAQLAELLALFEGADEALLRMPCPARQKLGDGTVAAIAAHTVDNYRRIAEFAVGSSAAPGHDGGGAHRTPWFIRLLGHRPPSHGPAAGHAEGYDAGSVT